MRGQGRGRRADVGDMARRGRPGLAKGWRGAAVRLLGEARGRVVAGPTARKGDVRWGAGKGTASLAGGEVAALLVPSARGWERKERERAGPSNLGRLFSAAMVLAAIESPKFIFHLRWLAPIHQKYSWPPKMMNSLVVYIVHVVGNRCRCGFNIKPANTGLKTLYPKISNSLPSLLTRSRLIIYML